MLVRTMQELESQGRIVSISHGKSTAVRLLTKADGLTFSISKPVNPGCSTAWARKTSTMSFGTTHACASSACSIKGSYVTYGPSGEALAASSMTWDVTVSPEALAGGTSVAGHRLFATEVPTTIHVRSEPAMHLSVSLRSPRAQHLAEWVSISWRSGHAAAA